MVKQLPKKCSFGPVQFSASNADNPDVVRLNLSNAFWYSCDFIFFVQRLSTEPAVHFLKMPLR